jgi:hypothetical protein
MKKKSKLSEVTIILIFMGVALVIFSGVFLGPVTPSLEKAQESATLQNSRSIGICLLSYAQDHQGHYPDGKTSTEVFQQLIDGKYVEDPGIFYLRYLNIAGKVRPTSDRLKAENVCWDVTCCMDSASPDSLPAVFLTGYKVTYQAGVPAIPMLPPHKRTWSEWLHGEQVRDSYMVVCYKGIEARGIIGDKDGSIPNFIPADFDPKGKVYRQLTP